MNHHMCAILSLRTSSIALNHHISAQQANLSSHFKRVSSIHLGPCIMFELKSTVEIKHRSPLSCITLAHYFTLICLSEVKGSRCYYNSISHFPVYSTLCVKRDAPVSRISRFIELKPGWIRINTVNIDHSKSISDHLIPVDRYCGRINGAMESEHELRVIWLGLSSNLQMSSIHHYILCVKSAHMLLIGGMRQEYQRALHDHCLELRHSVHIHY